MKEENRTAQATGRREFLSRLSAAVASASVLGNKCWAEQRNPQGTAPLPTIQLGKYSITRLIAGWNPIGGYSYLGHAMDGQMREYFTTEHTIDLLQQCERDGINSHQFSMSGNTAQILRTLRERGSKMNFICLHSGRDLKGIVESTLPMAMSHHGGATDALFRQGKSREVHDFVKAAHNLGMLAGVSAHNPDCIKQIAAEGWEVDFFMTCFYYLTRTKPPETGAKPSRLLDGPAVGYPFYAADPLAMTQVARQVKQPCLGFKILGAGRMCASQRTVQEAFKFAFEHLKPIDAVIVGMYPRSFDQVRANVQYTREFGTLLRGSTGVQGGGKEFGSTGR